MPRSSLEQTYNPPHTGLAMHVDPRYNQASSNFLQRIVNNGLASAGGAAAVTVKLNQSGTLFNNRGCTQKVTYTLPAITSAVAGMWFEFYNTSAYGMAVASAAGDDIVAFNDAAADSITYDRTGEMIGQSCKVIFDGTGWLLIYPNKSTTSGVIAT